MPLYSRLAAQSRSHAGCALGGDRLAICVCGQKTFRDLLSVTANRCLQTHFSRWRLRYYSTRICARSPTTRSPFPPFFTSVSVGEPRARQRPTPKPFVCPWVSDVFCRRQFRRLQNARRQCILWIIARGVPRTGCLKTVIFRANARKPTKLRSLLRHSLR